MVAVETEERVCVAWVLGGCKVGRRGNTLGEENLSELRLL